MTQTTSTSSNARHSFAQFVALGLTASLFALTGCKHPGDANGDESPAETDTSEQADDDEAEKPSCEAPEIEGLGAEEIVEDRTFESPTYLTQAPGDDQTLYLLERPGRILRIRNGEVLEEPFLDIRDRVGTGHKERGLLGLAFHPEYEENGRFFIFYTPSDEHKNVVAEYHRSDEGELADADEVRRLVDLEDPDDNHNGGMIAFGPDGYLFVGLGDGGGAGDRHGDIGNGQNRQTLLGSILRLDVDAADSNFVPDDNPFVDGEGKPQIWAWGLRNPWRFSFDRKTGDLYIGDVGQNAIEEIDVEPAESEGGRNYGWRAWEGNEVFDEDLVDDVDEHAEPVVDYQQRSQEPVLRGGCSVTGGYVYRGDAIDGLRGAYLYGDYCSGDIVAFKYCDGEVVGHQRIPGLEELGTGLGSFGEDLDGEVYLLYHDSGEVKKIIPE